MISKVMVKQILEDWPKFEWQLQGFGMLRTYLDGPYEPRLHIWDQRLAKTGNNAVHDHPWHFQSKIIAGTIFNQRFDYGWLASQGPTHEEVTIVPGVGGGVQEGERRDVALVPKPVEVYGADEEYGQRRDWLHITRYAQSTITVIERRGRTEDIAHSLHPLLQTTPWDFFEPRPATPLEIENVINDALKAWWM